MNQIYYCKSLILIITMIIMTILIYIIYFFQSVGLRVEV